MFYCTYLFYQQVFEKQIWPENLHTKNPIQLDRIRTLLISTWTQTHVSLTYVSPPENFWVGWRAPAVDKADWLIHREMGCDLVLADMKGLKKTLNLTVAKFNYYSLNYYHLTTVYYC